MPEMQSLALVTWPQVYIPKWARTVSFPSYDTTREPHTGRISMMIVFRSCSAQTMTAGRVYDAIANLRRKPLDG